MPTPKLKPDDQKRCSVQVIDRKTRKSRSFTLYGVTPAQAVDLLKRGVQLVQKEQQGQEQPTPANADAA